MKNSIKCPVCGEEFKLSDAITHDLLQEAKSLMADSHKHDLEKVRLEEAEKNNKEISIERERNKKLLSQIEEMLDQMRKLREKDEEREIEMKKRLIEEQEKIRDEVRKKTEEEHTLKDLEKDKKLNDALKQIDDLKNKIQQGSQQTQGESLEIEIETRLKQEYPNDIINEVKKGVRGADINQEVVNKNGKKCGTILWETKNAVWSDGWISKLKEDQRQAKADVSVIVSVNLPKDIDGFSYKDGVWICSTKTFMALSFALRFNLISLYQERQGQVGKDEKMQILYQYLTGSEFKHRVEGIVESFTVLQEELEKEKRWFGVKWARQEKEIRKVIDHTHGMYGDLQGVIGKSLPEINTLTLSEVSHN